MIQIENKFKVKDVVLFLDSNIVRVGLVSGVKYEEEITYAGVYKKELKYTVKYKPANASVESSIVIAENLMFENADAILEYYKKYANGLLEEYKKSLNPEEKAEKPIRQSASVDEEFVGI